MRYHIEQRSDYAVHEACAKVLDRARLTWSLYQCIISALRDFNIYYLGEVRVKQINSHFIQPNIAISLPSRYFSNRMVSQSCERCYLNMRACMLFVLFQHGAKQKQLCIRMILCGTVLSLSPHSLTSTAHIHNKCASTGLSVPINKLVHLGIKIRCSHLNRNTHIGHLQCQYVVHHSLLEIVGKHVLLKVTLESIFYEPFL